MFEPLSEVRWGILGCGDVCEAKGGPNALNQPGSRVVHVMRRDADAAADFARRHGVPRSSGEVDAVLADPEVNAVYIATPPGSHAELALKVADAGMPCLVEKPMARTADECWRMCEVFEAARLPLFVAYYRRRLPRWLKVKALIDGGSLGTLTHLDYRLTRPHWPDPPAQWRLDPAQSGGGLVYDVGSHLIDILHYLAGDLTDPKAVARNHSTSGVEDTLSISFAAGRATGTATWNFAGCVKEDVLTITGTAGRVTISCLGNEPFTFESAGGGGGVETFDLPSPSDVQTPLATTIIHDLRTGEQTCPSTGRTAMKTNEFLDLTAASLRDAGNASDGGALTG